MCALPNILGEQRRERVVVWPSAAGGGGIFFHFLCMNPRAKTSQKLIKALKYSIYVPAIIFDLSKSQLLIFKIPMTLFISQILLNLQ